MSRNELRGRENWQTASGPSGLAGIAEKDLIRVFEEAFEGTEYVINDHPTNFKHLYETVELPEEILSQIFCPDESAMRTAMSRGWGVSPDFSITNTITGKSIFGEIKRQDGWVEGKSPSAGRGNAHERMCKLFTPGLMKVYKEMSHIESEEILPFWVVLEGDITRDPKRNREIAFWFDVYDKNYFMWRPNMTGAELVEHFNRYLKPYLE